MVKHDDILKLASSFELQADAQIANKAQNLFSYLKNNILTYTNGALSAAKYLLNQPKYKSSQGLNAIKRDLPNLINTLKGLTAANIGFTLQTAKGQLENLLFYTARSNAGTGYDPITSVKMDGFSSPATLLKLSEETLTKIEALENKNTKPQSSNPNLNV